MSASTATPTSPEILRGFIGARAAITGEPAQDMRHDYDVFRANPDALPEDVQNLTTLNPGDHTLGVVTLRSSGLSGRKFLGAVAQLSETESDSVNSIEVDITDERANRCSIIANLILEAEQGVEPGKTAQIEAQSARMCFAAQKAGYILLGQDQGAAIFEKRIEAIKNPVSVPPPRPRMLVGFIEIPPRDAKK